MHGNWKLGSTLLMVAGLFAWNGCDEDTVTDTTPPAPIGDLSGIPVSATSARLHWTAPGDNGLEGQAARYRVAFSTSAEALAIINYCTSGILGLATNPVPRVGGSPETLLVTQLVPGQTYRFRLEAEDVALNLSQSNTCVVTLPDTTPPAPRWQYLGDAFDGVVLSLVPDGSGLIAVGLFTKIGSVAFPGIARWTGAAWEAMNAGLPDTTHAEIVSLLLRSGATVQGRPAICGSLTRRVGTADRVFPYVATWNGASWDSLATGRTGEGFDLIEYNNRLVLAGNFQNIGNVTGANGVASWNGTDWTSVGPDSTFRNASLSSLAVDGATLLVAGSFDTTEVVPSKRLARFNGVSWGAWGATDPPGSVFTTEIFNGEAIVAGAFGLRRIAPGGSPDTLGLGLRHANCSSATANALFLDGGRLLVGGNFNLAGEVRSLCLASWTGTRWNTLGRDDNIGVSAMTRLGAQIAVSGGFDADSTSGPKIRVATILQ